MKQVFALLLLALFATACAGNYYETEEGIPIQGGAEATPLSGPMAPNDEGIIEIMERFFHLQFIEVEFNQEEFIGQTFRYEGMFRTLFWEDGEAGGEYVHHVYRFTEPCCTPSEFVGWEVYLGEFEAPQYGDWVRVTGVLEHIEDGGFLFLQLQVTNLEILEERGLEYIRPAF